MLNINSRHKFRFKTFAPRHWYQFKSSYSLKYAFYLLLAMSFGLILLEAPVLYLINQNYDFFLGLAIHKSPSLISHLEKERVWINIIFFINGISLFVLNSWLVHRLIQKFEGPVKGIERHLKKLIYGHWNIPELKVREKDEFKHLVEEYNYFYKTLQVTTEKEIQILEMLKFDKTNRESYSQWINLLHEKKSRMGYEEIALENTFAASSSTNWRRVS